MSSTCILWTAGQANGYGIQWYPPMGRPVLSHRVVMLELHVPIAGMHVRHLCHTPLCVNPEHLTVGTAKDNTADTIRDGLHYNQLKTHCKRGHPYDEANTYVHQGKRHCRKCVSMRQAAYSQRRAEG